MSTQDSLAKRAISSTLWRSSSSLIGTAVMFVRSVLLARWLPVEVFGIYGYASSIIQITGIAANFGMSSAFLHISKETEDAAETAESFLTLRLLLNLVWGISVTTYALRWADPQYRAAMVALTVIHAGVHLTAAPRLILQRRIVHRRLSLLGTASIVLGSAAALAIARLGKPLWSLLITDLVTLIVHIVGLYVWRPVWRPRLGWRPSIVRYLFSFGWRDFLAGLLGRSLDRLDDVWTGQFLGSTAAGYYSKAYAFATYPRRIIATPLLQVSLGSYAALKGDRLRLSQAFFRVNALLVRAGFLFGGLLALTAPELIALALGERWLPMLGAYRLMLVFALLDPIKATVANLFTAVGHPQRVLYARAIQLLVLILGLVILGPRFGIAGVALAVDAMLGIGIALLLWQSREYVDCSIVRLFGPPALALTLALVIPGVLLGAMGDLGSDLRHLAVKLSVYPFVYAGFLIVTERAQINQMLQWVLGTIQSAETAS